MKWVIEYVLWGQPIYWVGWTRRTKAKVRGRFTPEIKHAQRYQYKSGAALARTKLMSRKPNLNPLLLGIREVSQVSHG